jgi:hypothetical protein
MGKRDDLIAQYAQDLEQKCGVTPDMDLLKKVTIGLGPVIYNADSSTVAATDPAEVARIRTNFLMGKLGLSDGPDLDAGIQTAIDTYGASERRKFRAVMYYLLVVHFGRESAYG